MNNGIKNVIGILLLIAVGVLGFLTYKSIAGPVEFDKTQKEREAVLQKKLKDIVKFQKAYEERYKRFGTAEELKVFLAQDSIFSVHSEGEYTSEMRDKGKTEAELAKAGNDLYVASKFLFLKKLAGENTEVKTRRGRHKVSSEEKLAADVFAQVEALKSEGKLTDEKAIQKKGFDLLIAGVIKENLLVRDTTWTAANTLLAEGVTIDQAFEVPAFGKTTASMIEIDTATIPQYVGTDTIRRPVFSAQVPCVVYLKDLDKNRLKDKVELLEKRLDGKGYAGLKIGSLTEIKTTGNWE